ncbi:hypothetical protein [Alteraurantiacibacter buctensis]|uniref:Uncharacterized protein n=1 Tax=Alteraurantiacibacter buctensis TaxID=1503981 RepID=A0A844Z0I6_9SPHN|nr:hypothetical protein [Alteraurantiacibacter buctensis]MXO71443.1 hypothetical protein [Alteraurantiacibacter buctensis]
MDRNWRDSLPGIERVDYESEYGLLADDAVAGCLLEAAEYFGPGLDEGEGGVAPAFEGGGAAPTPGPSRSREGGSSREVVPLPPAGGVRGGGGAADFSPQTRPPARPGPEPLLTRPLQAVFCEHLARHGNVRLACRAARVSAQTAYRMRRACGQFRALWDAALVIARDQVEDVLADRAVHGWEEAVFYHGEEVARRRRYDSRLLLAHLARLDRLAERAAGGVVERFDAALEALSADEALVLDPAEAAVASVSGVVTGDGETLAQAETPAAGDGAPEPGVPLLEAQLCWLEEHHGDLTEEEEIFHLLHTVPGVPGSALRLFGWTGSEAELAADRARWQARRAAWEAQQGGGEPEAPSAKGAEGDAISPGPARC